MGADLHDTGPIRTRLARRDAPVPDADFFIVYLDSYHDHRTAYRFAVNPSGMMRDEIVQGDSRFGDASWDPVWEVATEVREDGWTVEMRIPFSQLRFSRETVQEWGIQIERRISRREERAVFAFTPKLESGGVPRFGHLEGIRGIRPEGRLELLPYAGARAEYVRRDVSDEVAFSNPYRSGSDYFGSAGLDLKYRVSSNLTLDATVNPDFGQVEVDPAVINLTAFETRYDEKRPFFVESSEIFEFSDEGGRGSTGRPPQPVYSRRIGRAPQGAVPGEAVYADVPQATTILGAAKVTGRTRDGWSVGFLEAVTQRETAPWIDADRDRSESVVEPATNYLVGRVRRDLAQGRSRVGVLATAVNRRLDGTGLAGSLHEAAYQAGFDFRHETSDRGWRFGGALATARVEGTTGAVLATQRSSARYFHRPDASHLALDSTSTSMNGYYARLATAKQSGSFLLRATLASVSPGYEINDLGFLTETDRLIFDTDFAYRQTVPGDVVRNWRLNGGPDVMWNHGGERVFGEFNVTLSGQLLSYWGGSLRLAYRPAAADDRLTRGGPLARSPEFFGARLRISSDHRKPLRLRLSERWEGDRSGAWRSTTGLDATLRIRDRWQVSLGPRLTRRHETAQYVTAVADPLAASTYGKRYVFAPLDQTTLAVETRVNVTFTPTLSFELYAQPFLSSGDYGALAEFRAPETFDFLRYGRDVGTVEEQGDGRFRVDPDGSGPAGAFEVADRDFDYRSLLGNAVLRWEWRPGSTLFLVWQQSRDRRYVSGDATPEGRAVGDFDLDRDAGELFDLRPDNIFLVKVDYWLNP